MKNKHLTYADRVLIEDLLNQGNANLTTIAKSFDKRAAKKNLFLNSPFFLFCSIDPLLTKLYLINIASLKNFYQAALWLIL